MTKTIRSSGAPSPPTSASPWSGTLRGSLPPVPETRGTWVTVCAAPGINASLPEGFSDIDAVIEENERDPFVRQAVALGRHGIADTYYANGARPLAWYRLKNGWSQEVLARRLGISQSYIARLEAQVDYSGGVVVVK